MKRLFCSLTRPVIPKSKWLSWDAVYLNFGVHGRKINHEFLHHQPLTPTLVPLVPILAHKAGAVTEKGDLH